MTAILIVATDRNGGIGLHGNLPWRNPADLQRFRARTMGHALIMGRTTYDSIGQPLPGRDIHVVSRRTAALDGVKVHSSPEAAFVAASAAHGTVFVAGGAQLYLALAASCAAIDRTIVPGEHQCDAFLDVAVFDGFCLDSRSEIDGLIIEDWRRAI